MLKYNQKYNNSDAKETFELELNLEIKLEKEFESDGENVIYKFTIYTNLKHFNISTDHG